MATYNLYIDTQGNQLVAGVTDPSTAALPPLVQGDTLNLNIYLLTRNSPFPQNNPPFSVIGTGGLTLQVTIGDERGDTNNFYAAQLIWTPDPSGLFFSAQLSLATTAITTLLGTNGSASLSATGQTIAFEVKYLQGGLPTTVFRVPVTILAAVNKEGSVGPVPVGQTPLSAETATAIFLTRTIVGQIVLQSGTTGKKIAIFANDDGTLGQAQLN